MPVQRTTDQMRVYMREYRKRRRANGGRPLSGEIESGLMTTRDAMILAVALADASQGIEAAADSVLEQLARRGFVLIFRPTEVSDADEPA